MRMVRAIITLLIVISASRSAWAFPDEASEMLARAEALYYEADFAKSIELLLRTDDLLRQSGDVKQKTDVKLQLALSYIGLNDTARAKTYLGELFALDSDRRIDSQVYSPKVIQLADEAKAELNDRRCRSLLDETQRQLASSNGDAVLKLIGSSQTKCSELAVVFPKAAELVFKEGLDAYKKAQMKEALQKFRAAIGLEPKHELAAQYVELTERKLEVTADGALLAWRKNFNAGDYALAARDYRELVSVSSSATVDEVRGEYSSALSSLVDSWNRACAQEDTAQMEEMRVRINALLPEPSFGEDILAKMTTCTRNGCIQMNPQVALARLKTRVDPQFASFVVSQIRVSPVTVRVKVRINEKGDIVTSEPQGGNPLLYNGIRTAMEQWKFSPAIRDGEPRCVDAEIPIVITFKN
jgi:tetratricopeptide (TPR) repeat protein